VRTFKTEQRLQRIIDAVTKRQQSLRVVLENIHDPHNVSAIFRTCDAVGVPKVSLLYNKEHFPKISRISSASANKWVQRERFCDVEECYLSLKQEGFKIYASALSNYSKNLFELDLTKKVAIVMGNEHRGVSEKASELADEVFFIPMHGMVQSLNVSVATAVILYEVQRQRSLKGMYNESELSCKELDSLIDEWCSR